MEGKGEKKEVKTLREGQIELILVAGKLLTAQKLSQEWDQNNSNIYCVSQSIVKVFQWNNALLTNSKKKKKLIKYLYELQTSKQDRIYLITRDIGNEQSLWLLMNVFVFCHISLGACWEHHKEQEILERLSYHFRNVTALLPFLSPSTFIHPYCSSFLRMFLSFIYNYLYYILILYVCI